MVGWPIEILAKFPLPFWMSSFSETLPPIRQLLNWAGIIASGNGPCKKHRRHSSFEAADYRWLQITDDYRSLATAPMKKQGLCPLLVKPGGFCDSAGRIRQRWCRTGCDTQDWRDWQQLFPVSGARSQSLLVRRLTILRPPLCENPQLRGWDFMWRKSVRLGSTLAPDMDVKTQHGRVSFTPSNPCSNSWPTKQWPK